MPSSLRTSGGLRTYSGNNFYRTNVYRPASTTTVNGSRTLSYPAVRGSMTAIHSNVSGSHHLKGSQLSASRNVQKLTGINQHVSAGKTSAKTTQKNRIHNNLSAKSKLDPQTASQLRHWNGKRDSATEARQKNLAARHDHHDRHWWRRHCDAFILFDFGWWGWWDGWWYPAWGYDPYYSYYGYDQPIYSYDGLAPDQIVANVQSALQQQGYFSYAVDGQMGPLTRAAIVNYQRDHMLPITGNVDPATLGALGLTD